MDKVTFDDLISYHISKNQTGSKISQTLQNERAALNQFLGFHNYSLDTIIPDWFADEGKFNLKVEEYIRNADLSEKTLAPRRAQIKKFRKSYQEMVVSVAAPKDFKGALTYHMKQRETSIRGLGRDSGVPSPTIQLWKSGIRYPIESSLHEVIKIENALGLSPGTLTSLMPVMRKKERLTKTTHFGKYQSDISKKKYLLKTSAWPEKCRAQFFAICDFKLDDIGRKGTVRHLMSGWRRADPETGSKRLYEAVLAQIWGYLVLPKPPVKKKNPDLTIYGQGMAMEELGLENLLDTDLVEEYLKFKKMRAGAYNRATLTNLIIIKTIIHPEHGFIVQRPDLFPEISDLKSRCNEAHKRYKEIIGHLKARKLIQTTRDPMGMCMDILNHPRPLDVLIKLGMNAQTYAEKRWGGRKITFLAAVDYRDALIVNLLPRIPLRRKNYCRMTWRADNSGHLYKQHDGSWWLHIPKAEFKNEKGAAGERDFNVPIRPEIWPMIEFYLFQCRPVLLRGKESDYVFLNRNNKRIGLDHFSFIVAFITNSFSPIPTPGFRPHAYRHLVATHYLRQNPENVEVVAQVLHDKPETVRKAYAHLLVKDGYRHYNDHIGKILDEKKKEDDGGQKVKASPALSAEQIMIALGKLSPAERKRVMAEVMNG